MTGNGDAAADKKLPLPPVFEQLLADIFKDESAATHIDLAHRFGGFYLRLIADGIETAAAVSLTGQWMRSIFEHRRATDSEEAG